MLLASEAQVPDSCSDTRVESARFKETGLESVVVHSISSADWRALLYCIYMCVLVYIYIYIYISARSHHETGRLTLLTSFLKLNLFVNESDE
jgi:hypothetical protein